MHKNVAAKNSGIISVSHAHLLSIYKERVYLVKKLSETSLECLLIIDTNSTNGKL